MKENTFYVELGKILKSIRISKGYSQEYVSKRMNVSRTSIASYELGTRIITIDKLYDFCNVYDVDPNDVINPIRHLAKK